ncbi:MAG: DnaB-like helicase C-terminal domain-containing protein [Syntrophomonas sp.]|uniref:replicative DNA helicase n=1 Tax=Syntrophomonas sp. TaxID=2053627 RepID=UPI0026197A6D|nr:DnaB-like helicase C-terminal domain-containing protein [Syntrophomonas sp.]MDD2511063.1 DnaB-like helicase C-terminal domain-containing protein [Syntrophomonas sp.]MDD3879330.1 DnaB-like helicase C-terminal domain-containing protein [Syntrophomonas sp.]MDD4626387.1 DnaB-like helicase C-terminal domain-containing protein [Syntrophomonas sp.]
MIPLSFRKNETSMEDYLIDLESERRVLSSMLHSEDACIEVYDLLSNADFYSPRHATIFDLAISLFEREIRPTLVELLKEGHSLGVFTNPRDIEELKYIVEQYIDDENIKYWIKKVKDKARLRKFEAFLKRNMQLLIEKQESDVEQVLMAAEEELTNLTALEIDDKIDSPADMANLGYSEVERRFLRLKEIRELHKGVLPLDGLPTGFDNLNHITLGYKAGDLIILGAQTGHGKTSFALHTSRAIAVDGRKNLLYLNTEMSREQIALRWGSILSQIDHDRVRSGDINETELSIILNGYSQLRESGFYSYPCPNLTPEKAISIARKFKAQKSIEMMIVDYVGRMDKLDPKLSEWQILEQIVKTLKMLAQNLKIVVMCLVQLNPDGSLQGAKRMKNECDLMLKLTPISREELEEREELKNYINPNYYIHIDKNRDGRSGVRIPITFDLQKQIMGDAKRIDE